MHELRIPKTRIAVVIGTNGSTKKELEEISGTDIDVDSKEGIVTIEGSDAIKLYQTKEMIIAIGRGFSPEIARILLKHDYIMEVITLIEFADKKKQLDRIRGRIIGTRGKSREIMEELTETNISVYGKTIAVIGLPENVVMARNAIDTLIDGASHATVYKRLEAFRRKMKEARMLDLA